MEATEFIENFRLFNRFYANLLDDFDQRFYGNFFSLVESRVVTEIYEQQLISAKEISQQLGIDKGQLSKIVKKLEKKAFIQRTTDQRDKRSYYLSLTSLGKIKHEQQVKKIQEELFEEVSRYSDSELSRLNSAMTIFQRTYQQHLDITIEEGTFEDIGFIADIHSRVYGNEGLAYGKTFHFYVFSSLTKFLEEQPKGKIWIAKVENKKVGTISLIQTENQSWQVRWFVLDTEYQGMGIGKQLIQTLVRYIQNNKLNDVYLWTVNELCAARSLYQRNGFKQIERIPNKEWRPEILFEEKWVYEKSLGKEV